MTTSPDQDRPPVLQPSFSQRRRARRPAIFGSALAVPLLLGPFLAVLLLSTSACSSNSASAVSGSEAEEQITFGVEMARRQLWNEALFRFEQAAKMAPGNPRVYNNLAVACEATGQFEKALEYYKQGLQRDPGNQELKKNYARFVEFYRGFAPADEEAPEGDSP